MNYFRRHWYQLGFVAAIVVIAVIFLGFAAILIYLSVHPTKSDNLFDTALTNALQTNSFTQTNTNGVSDLTIQYDVSNPSDTKVQSSGKLDQGNSVTAFNGYGTFKDSFIKFTTFTTDNKSVPQIALNKWFQVRKSGFDASSGYFSTLFQMIQTPRFLAISYSVIFRRNNNKSYLITYTNTTYTRTTAPQFSISNLKESQSVCLALQRIKKSSRTTTKSLAK